MPKISGMRERIHQPYWDSIVLAGPGAAPNPLIGAETRLFSGGANQGNIAWTNMPGSGSFLSDSTYQILALRIWTHFSGAGAQSMYHWTAQQLFCTLRVGEKNYFQWQCFYTPAGGGTWGFDSTQPLSNNGTPDQQATMRLGKPISLPARQSFVVLANFYAVGANDVRTVMNGTPAVSREIKVIIDGLITRDVA